MGMIHGALTITMHRGHQLTQGLATTQPCLFSRGAAAACRNQEVETPDFPRTPQCAHEPEARQADSTMPALPVIRGRRGQWCDSRFRSKDGMRSLEFASPIGHGIDAIDIRPQLLRVV
jgi:hypothetical protein